MTASALAISDFFREALGHIAAAVFCGVVVGFERQLRRKAIGIRPCVIVVLTTALLTHLGAGATEEAGDPSRVVAAIVSGIGFLGGGVILAQGARIRGVTTASLIWALAATGVAIGLGYRYTAVAMVLTVMAVMILTDFVERLFPALRREDPLRRDE